MPLPGRDHAGADVAARVAALAQGGAGLLLELDPVLGDHPTQVAVDRYVERAAEALTALGDAARRGPPADGPRAW
jgi:hypothetical protein